MPGAGVRDYRRTQMATAVPKLRLAGLRSISLRPANSLRRFGTIFFVTGSVVFVLLILERFLTLVSAFSGIVMICFLAWLLAFVVSPVVDGAARRLHIGRGIAVGLVYACVALTLVGLVLAAGSTGIAEAQNLVNQLDEGTATISGSL